jgi:hypothetical protein
MIEEECGGEPESCGGGESIAELDGHEGIEPELLEGPVRLEGAGGREAEDARSVRSDQVEQCALAVGYRQGKEALGKGGVRRSVGGDASCGLGSDEASEQGMQSALPVRAKGGEVEGCGDEGGVGTRECVVEEGETLVGGEGA